MPKQQNKTIHTPIPACEASQHKGVCEYADTVACIDLLCVYANYMCDKEKCEQ